MTLPPEVKRLIDRSAWHGERKALRTRALGAGLAEAVKWGKLCYNLDDTNIVIIHATNTYCALGFFMGALLHDPDHRLVVRGEHSQAMRQLRFITLAGIEAQGAVIRSFLAQAIAAKHTGCRIDFDEKHNLDLPDELKVAFDRDPDLAAAFDSLSPGRQRGYVLHLAAAKQAETRFTRIASARDRIMAGKGRNDR